MALPTPLIGLESHYQSEFSSGFVIVNFPVVYTYLELNLGFFLSLLIVVGL